MDIKEEKPRLLRLIIFGIISIYVLLVFLSILAKKIELDFFNPFIISAIILFVVNMYLFLIKKERLIRATEMNLIGVSIFPLASLISVYLLYFGFFQWTFPLSFMIGAIFVFTIISIISFIVYKTEDIQKILLPNEKVISSFDGIKLSGINYLGAASVMPFKRVLITNKSIVISFQLFGIETYKFPIKIYYKKSDYEKDHSFKLRIGVGSEYKLGKDSLSFKIEFLKMKIVKFIIHTTKAKEILEVIKKNK